MFSLYSETDQSECAEKGERQIVATCLSIQVDFMQVQSQSVIVDTSSSATLLYKMEEKKLLDFLQKTTRFIHQASNSCTQ